MAQTTITIEAEVSDKHTVRDIIKALDLILPYMCDNVIVRSTTR